MTYLETNIMTERKNENYQEKKLLNFVKVAL